MKLTLATTLVSTLALSILCSNCALQNASFEHRILSQPAFAENTCWSGSLATAYEFARNDLVNSFIHSCKIATTHFNDLGLDYDCCGQDYDLCSRRMDFDYMKPFIKKYINPFINHVYDDYQIKQMNFKELKIFLNQGILFAVIDTRDDVHDNNRPQYHTVVFYGYYNISNELVYVDPKPIVRRHSVVTKIHSYSVTEFRERVKKFFLIQKIE